MQKLNENRKYLQLLASETVRVNVPFFSLKYCWPGCLFTNVCRWTYIFKFIQWFLLDLIRLNCVPLFFFLFHSTSEHRLKAVSRSFFALFFWNTQSSLSISQNPISQLVESVPHKLFFYLCVSYFWAALNEGLPATVWKNYLDECSNVPAIDFFLFCVRFLLITNRFKYITRALVLCLNVDM